MLGPSPVAVTLVIMGEDPTMYTPIVSEVPFCCISSIQDNSVADIGKIVILSFIRVAIKIHQAVGRCCHNFSVLPVRPSPGTATESTIVVV